MKMFVEHEASAMNTKKPVVRRHTRHTRHTRHKRRAIAYNNTLVHPNRTKGEQSIYTEFGRRLQDAMVKRGWSQSDMARHATACLPKAAPGQKQGHKFIRDRISHYVRGVRMPRPEGLAVLAKALGMEPSDLLPPANIPYAGMTSAKVPHASKSPPDFEVTVDKSGRAMLRVNCAMSLAAATKIIAIIAKEKKPD